MKVRCEPFILEIKDKDIMYCPCCNNSLIKSVNKGHQLKGGEECRYCRYSDRPFAYCSSSWQNHFPNGCYCEWEEIEYINIKCIKCNDIKCIKCNENIECKMTNCNKAFCSNCEFSSKWKLSTPQEKLELYGIQKLKLLAKKKNIKGFSKLCKDDLIISLSNVVDNNDFPIK